MTYIGEVHNGVVVLKDAPALEEGTKVRVEVEASAQKRVERKFPRGSPEAVLQFAARSAGSWADSAAEMDEALEYIRQTKWEDVRRQDSEPEPGL
jgi:hypothetical protein